jgi:hypothetical protein
MKKDLIISKQKELIDIQAMAISYFRKYSGESERITRFINSIHEKQTELSALENQLEPKQELFLKPTDKELVEIALLFNDGKIQKSKLRDMVAMSEFIIDRLYEHGNISKPSSKE